MCGHMKAVYQGCTSHCDSRCVSSNSVFLGPELGEPARGQSDLFLSLYWAPGNCKVLKPGAKFPVFGHLVTSGRL